MKILILGAGGVGAYIGAQLLKNRDADVYMAARGEHLSAIEKNGLRITEDNESYTVHPALFDPQKDSGMVFDLVLVTVKQKDLKSALESILNNISNSTLIIPLLNGISHIHTIESLTTGADTLKGCVYIVSNIKKPGVIRKRGEVFKMCWGKQGIDPDRYKRVSELFDKSGLRHTLTSDIDRQIWKKYLFISPMAMLTSYYDIDMHTVFKEHRDELRMLMEETASLARSKDIDIYEKDILSNMQQASKVPPGSLTSLQIDLKNGKTPELYALAGYIPDEAEKHGIKTPLSHKIFRSLVNRYANSASLPHSLDKKDNIE